MKLNNTDRWMIERWEKLRQIEAGMADTRQRFESIYHEVHQHVKKSHPALDRIDVHLSPGEVSNYGGNIVFSKSSWPHEWETWRTGIYLWGATLDELSTKPDEGTSIYLFLQVKRSDKRIERFRDCIKKEAPRVLKGKIKKWSAVDDDDRRVLLWYQLPEGKERLLWMLRDGHEQEFVNCLSKHVGIMAGFVPVLDKLFK